VLSTSKQMGIAAGVAGCALWMGVCTAAMLVNLLSASSTDREIAKLKAQSERYVADRQARLDSALARLDAPSGTNADVAATMEKRHAALALLLTDLKGAPGAAEALTPAINRALASNSASPGRRVEQIRIGQEQLLDAADTFAKSRADRLRLAFRMAGLTPSAYVDHGGSLGGPLIEAKDPRALAAVLDVDEDFAQRIQRAAKDLSDASPPRPPPPRPPGRRMTCPCRGRPAAARSPAASASATTPSRAGPPTIRASTSPAATPRRSTRPRPASCRSSASGPATATSWRSTTAAA